MRIIQEVSFDVVVHSWLSDEWEKDWYDGIRTQENIIIVKTPDFSNNRENHKRYNMLCSRRLPMMSEILQQAKWYQCHLNKEDIHKIFHINHESWNTLNSIKKKGIKIYLTFLSKTEMIGKIEQIKDTISKSVDGILLVGQNLNSTFTIIEGNHRFSAILNKTENHTGVNIICNAYVGINENFKNYKWYYKTENI